MFLFFFNLATFLLKQQNYHQDVKHNIKAIALTSVDVVGNKQPGQNVTAKLVPPEAENAEGITYLWEMQTTTELPEVPSSSAADETPSSAADETPSSEADETPSSAADETPSSAADETPSSAADETPSSEAGETPSSEADETPSSEADETPSSAADETPSSAADETPSSEAGETPSSEADETPSSEADETPSSAADETPSSAADETPSSEADETPSSAADETPSSEADETPSSEADETPSSEADETPSSEADETPSSEADETPSSEADETPSSEADETPSSEADETPSSEADETPSSEADETPSSEADETPSSEADETPSSAADDNAPALVLEASSNDPDDSSAPAADPEDSSAPAVDPEDSSAPAADPEDSSAPAADPEDSSAPAADPEDSSAPAADPEDSSAPAADPEDSSAAPDSSEWKTICGKTKQCLIPSDAKIGTQIRVTVTGTGEFTGKAVKTFTVEGPSPDASSDSEEPTSASTNEIPSSEPVVEETSTAPVVEETSTAPVVEETSSELPPPPTTTVTCLDNDKFCIECSKDQKTCTKCKDGYKLEETELKCILSTIDDPSCRDYDDHCIKCDDKDKKKCAQCIDGFRFDSNRKCVKACQDPNCNECKDDITICTKCNKGYGLTGGICSKCQNDDEDGTKPCPIVCDAIPGCLRCFEENYQLYCESSYQGCDYSNGYRYDPITHGCIKITCTDMPGCLACNESDTSKCISCDASKNFNLTKYGYCECFEGFENEYDNGACYNIKENECTTGQKGSGCVKCSGPEKCTSCDQTHQLKDGKCEKLECTENCETNGCALINGVNQCVRCKNGFIANRDFTKCLPKEPVECPSNVIGCSECLKDYTSFCIKCQENFDFSSVYPGTCVCDEEHDFVDNKCIERLKPLPPPDVVPEPIDPKKLIPDPSNAKNVTIDATGLKTETQYRVGIQPNLDVVNVPEKLDVRLELDGTNRNEPLTIVPAKDSQVELLTYLSTTELKVPSDSQQLSITGSGEIKLDPIPTSGDQKADSVTIDKLSPRGDGDNQGIKLVSDNANITVQNVQVYGKTKLQGQAKEGQVTKCENVYLERGSDLTVENVELKDVVIGLISVFNIKPSCTFDRDSKLKVKYNRPVGNRKFQYPLNIERIGGKYPDFSLVSLLIESADANETLLLEDEATAQQGDFPIAQFTSPDEKNTTLLLEQCQQLKDKFSSSVKEFDEAQCINATTEDERVYNLVARKGTKKKDDDDGGLSGGAIAGIVIACIVVVAAIIALLVYFLVIKKRNQSTTSTQGDSSIAI